MSKYRLSDDCVFDPNKHKMTPEEEKAFDEYFDANYEAFCETAVRTGSASMSDPHGLRKKRPLSERLKDGSTIITDYVDASGDMPFPEYMRKALNGDFDEKGIGKTI